MNMRNISTQFGDSVICDLAEPQDMDNKFSVFLTKRYAGVHSNEELAPIPEGKYFLAAKKEVPVANGKCTYDIDIDIVKEKSRRTKKQ